jgi:peptide/nickel transport system substrate-binding protein
MTQRVIHFLLLILVLDCPSADAAEPRRGGIVRFGVSRTLQTLNPFVRTQSVDHWVRSLVYEGLLAQDEKIEIMPALAQSWTVSPDGLTYQFALRPGVRFHDGRPFTAADVAWSIEYVQDPKNGAYGRSDLAVIEHVQVEDSHRIRVRLRSPFAPFLSALAGIQRLLILPKDSLKGAEGKPDALPPGTGPFLFSSWRTNQELRTARFDGYWQRGLPYLDEVRFVIALDQTVRMTAVRVGDLEIAERIPAEQVVQTLQGKVAGIGVVSAPSGNYPHISINHCQPPFSNVKVRQALAFALNKQEILQGAYMGLGTPTNQKLLRGTRWFFSEVPDRSQDLQKARALLAEAGFAQGLKAPLAGSPGNEALLQVIQAQAKRAGFELTTMVLDPAAHLAAFRKGEFQITVSGGNTEDDPDLAYYGYYHTPAEVPDRSGRTKPCYSNPQVDQLLENARRTPDVQRRKQMYREVIELLQEDVAEIPIAFVPHGFAYQSHVRDFRPTITSVFSYGNGGLLRTWLDR